MVLSSLLGFTSQMLYANMFGASCVMDVYFELLAIPAVLTGIAPIIFSSVLIPNLAKFKNNQSEIFNFTLWTRKVVFYVAVLFVLIGFTATALGEYFGNFLHTCCTYNEKFQLALMIWIGSGLSIVSSYYSALLNYSRRFVIVASTSLLPHIFIIILVLLLHDLVGVRSIAMGLSVAYLLQFLIFFMALKSTVNMSNYTPKHFNGQKELANQSFQVILSLIPFTTLVPIAFFWASKLEGGSTSILGFSQSLAGFLSVSVSMGIAVVSFPDLADNIEEVAVKTSLRKFENSLRYVMVFSIFAAGLLIALRIPILELIYLRGSFNVDDLEKLSSVLPWYLTAGVFTAGLNLLRNLFYSSGEVRKIAKLGLFVPIFFFVFAGLLKESHEFVGIAMAYSFTFFIFFLVMIVLAGKKSHFLRLNDFIPFLFKNFLCILLASFLFNLIFQYAPGKNFKFGDVFSGSIVFVAIYLLTAKLFMLKEINQLFLVASLRVKSLRKI